MNNLSSLRALDWIPVHSPAPVPLGPTTTVQQRPTQTPRERPTTLQQLQQVHQRFSSCGRFEAIQAWRGRTPKSRLSTGSAKRSSRRSPSPPAINKLCSVLDFNSAI
ncbi:hypothetical protein ACFX2A_033134 [Malus domestica]